MPANYKQLLALFQAKPKIIRDYFESFPELAEDYVWSVSVSYVFMKIEAVKHATLYCGIRKIHRADAEMAWDMLNKDHMSRGRFKELFEIVFGKPIEKPILDKLAAAEKMRDKVVHGTPPVTQPEPRAPAHEQPSQPGRGRLVWLGVGLIVVAIAGYALAS